MFEMSGGGLEEVLDPSQALLGERLEGTVGSAIAPILEGSRPLLVEIQALTSLSMQPVPRRTANGIDFHRMIMVSAVLSRRGRGGAGESGRDCERGRRIAGVGAGGGFGVGARAGFELSESAGEARAGGGGRGGVERGAAVGAADGPTVGGGGAVGVYTAGIVPASLGGKLPRGAGVGDCVRADGGAGVAAGVWTGAWMGMGWMGSFV